MKNFTIHSSGHFASANVPRSSFSEIRKAFSRKPPILLVILLSVSLLLQSQFMLAQAPQQFSFQGVARDASGKFATNKNILLGFEIHQRTPAGTVVFSESHNTTSDAAGVFNVKIGSVNTLPDIDWGKEPHYLKTVLFFDGLPSVIDLGTTQLLSVPYSLFATQSNDAAHSVKSDTSTISLTSKKWIDDEPIVQVGNQNSGSPLPDVGDGNTLIWYPKNGAFRVGKHVSNSWNRANMGTGSFATGTSTVASGDYSASFGYETQASGINSFAAGKESQATANETFALGYGVAATANNTVSIGRNSISSAADAISIGNTAVASATSSVALGYNSQAKGTNSIAFGNGSEATGQNSFAFGNSVASGIRSIAAGEGMLAKAADGIGLGTYNNSGDFPGAQPASTDRIFQIGNGVSAARSNAITVLRNGNVGIGNNVVQPEYIMDFGGRPRIKHNGSTAGLFFNNSQNAPEGFVGMKTDQQVGFYLNNTWAFWVDDAGYAHTKWGSLAFSSSDLRLKKDLNQLKNSLNSISKLNGYTYHWIDPKRDDGRLQDGVIAQEVEKVFPELVHNEENDFKSVDYRGLIPHLIEAIKELDKKTEEITALKKELASMQEMNQKLSALEASVKAMLASQAGTSTQTGK